MAEVVLEYRRSLEVAPFGKDVPLLISGTCDAPSPGHHLGLYVEEQRTHFLQASVAATGRETTVACPSPELTTGGSSGTSSGKAPELLLPSLGSEPFAAEARRLLELTPFCNDTPTTDCCTRAAFRTVPVRLRSACLNFCVKTWSALRPSISVGSLIRCRVGPVE